MPLIQSDTLRAVAAALAHHEVEVSVYRGQRGHPVRFSARWGPALLGLNGNKGAASVVSAHDAIELIVNDAGCATDIDTVDDLRAAERLIAIAAAAAISA